jgi:hypothetical protein
MDNLVEIFWASTIHPILKLMPSDLRFCYSNTPLPQPIFVSVINCLVALDNTKHLVA